MKTKNQARDIRDYEIKLHEIEEKWEILEDDECLDYFDKYKLVFWDYYRIIEKTKSNS